MPGSRRRLVGDAGVSDREEGEASAAVPAGSQQWFPWYIRTETALLPFLDKNYRPRREAGSGRGGLGPVR